MMLIKKKKKGEPDSGLHPLEILLFLDLPVQMPAFLTSCPIGSETGQNPCIKLETSWEFDYSSQYEY